jgi:hypothetical protein
MVENRHPYLLLKQIHCATMVGDCITQPATTIRGNGGRANANFSFAAASLSAPATCVGLLLYALTWPDGQMITGRPHLLVARRAEGSVEEREFFARFVDKATAEGAFALLSSDKPGNTPVNRKGDRLLLPKGESLTQQLFELTNAASMTSAGGMSLQRCTVGKTENDTQNGEPDLSETTGGLELIVQGDMSREGAVNLVVTVTEEALKRSATTAVTRREYRGSYI